MKMLKKDLTVREHLKTIQSDGGKARWAKLTPEERSAQARKIVGARWAKKKAAVALYDNFLRKASKARDKEIAQEQIAHPFTSKSSCAESVHVCSEIELPGEDSLGAALLQACRSFPRRLDISPWTH